MAQSVSDINFATTKVAMIQAGEPAGTATGFFFRHKNVKYLATNRHVVIDEKDSFLPDSLIITLHAGREDLSISIAIQVRLYEERRPLWKQHPKYESNHCDVVLIPLNDTTLDSENLLRFNSASIIFVGSDLVNDQEVNPFGEVVVVGYPLGFFDERNNLPVYRNATIASAYGVYFGGLPYFLIDANLHPGTSGSPVVNSHHTLFRDSGGKEGYKLFGVHSAEHVVNGDPLGLNVVWYAHLLTEIAEL